MNNRELFLNLMHHRRADRMPVVHWTGWPETLERWYKEGLPRDRDIHDVLGTRLHWAGIGANVGLFPLFAEETLFETAEIRTYRDSSGVVCQAWTNQSNIPHYIDLTLKTPQDWDQHYKRLIPLMKDGGYMMMPDHLITPGVSLADYRWYLDQVRALRF